MIEIDINPVAFLGVRWYGIAVAMAILSIVVWVGWHVKKDTRISLDTILMAALVGIPSGVVVSRLLHVLDLWEYYGQNPGQIIGGSGLTIWGAIIGASLGIWVYSKFAKVQFGYISDLIAPGLILAQIIGRMGCIVNGCCYGSESSLRWSIVYTHPHTAATPNIAFHPTQAYEIIYLLIAFVIILFLRNRLKPEGSLFITYLGIYSIWRIAVDFIREGTPFLFGLHQAQVIGIITLIFTGTYLIMKTRWIKAGEKIEDTAESPAGTEKYAETQIAEPEGKNGEEEKSPAGTEE
ncbi:prolipoprotein diacylglyceryl transferase [Chloroflexota bacterium]